MHFERVLFICGPQDSGKSTLIRWMFSDPRLGGKQETAPRIAAKFLSRERCLATRLTSPHEYMEGIERFFEKIEEQQCLAGRKNPDCRRFNLVGALQLDAANSMPDAATVCAELVKRFDPERVRLVVLNPGHGGESTSDLTHTDWSHLQKLKVECLTLNAQHPESDRPTVGNIRILADYFDFS